MSPLMQDANGTVQAAPWWGTPLIAGGFLIIGALVAFVSNYVTKLRELQAAEIKRWDTEILAMSARLMTISTLLDNAAVERAALPGGGLPLVDDFDAEVKECGYIDHRFSLVASADTTRATHSFVLSIVSCAHRSDLATVRETFQHMLNARAAFVDAVRAELRAKE
jgi:hypothetical protein